MARPGSTNSPSMVTSVYAKNHKPLPFSTSRIDPHGKTMTSSPSVGPHQGTGPMGTSKVPGGSATMTR